jgi:hypothetical protein
MTLSGERRDDDGERNVVRRGKKVDTIVLIPCVGVEAGWNQSLLEHKLPTLHAHSSAA